IKLRIASGQSQTQLKVINGAVKAAAAAPPNCRFQRSQRSAVALGLGLCNSQLTVGLPSWQQLYQATAAAQPTLDCRNVRLEFASNPPAAAAQSGRAGAEHQLQLPLLPPPPPPPPPPAVQQQHQQSSAATSSQPAQRRRLPHRRLRLRLPPLPLPAPRRLCCSSAAASLTLPLPPRPPPQPLPPAGGSSPPRTIVRGQRVISRRPRAPTHGQPVVVWLVSPGSPAADGAAGVRLWRPALRLQSRRWRQQFQQRCAAYSGGFRRFSPDDDGGGGADSAGDVAALQDLHQMLLMGNEDTLAGFPVKTACLHCLLDRLPRSSASVLEALPDLLEKAQPLEVIDVAGDGPVSRGVAVPSPRPRAVLLAGGVSACLRHVDFFTADMQAPRPVCARPTAFSTPRPTDYHWSATASHCSPTACECPTSASPSWPPPALARLLDSCQSDRGLLARLACRSDLLASLQQLLLLTCCGGANSGAFVAAAGAPPRRRSAGRLPGGGRQTAERDGGLAESLHHLMASSVGFATAVSAAQPQPPLPLPNGLEVVRLVCELLLPPAPSCPLDLWWQPQQQPPQSRAAARRRRRLLILHPRGTVQWQWRDDSGAWVALRRQTLIGHRAGLQSRRRGHSRWPSPPPAGRISSIWYGGANSTRPIQRRLVADQQQQPLARQSSSSGASSAAAAAAIDARAELLANGGDLAARLVNSLLNPLLGCPGRLAQPAAAAGLPAGPHPPGCRQPSRTAASDSVRLAARPACTLAALLAGRDIRLAAGAVQLVDRLLQLSSLLPAACESACVVTASPTAWRKSPTGSIRCSSSLRLYSSRRRRLRQPSCRSLSSEGAADASRRHRRLSRSRCFLRCPLRRRQLEPPSSCASPFATRRPACSVGIACWRRAAATLPCCPLRHPLRQLENDAAAAAAPPPARLAQLARRLPDGMSELASLIAGAGHPQPSSQQPQRLQRRPTPFRSFNRRQPHLSCADLSPFELLNCGLLPRLLRCLLAQPEHQRQHLRPLRDLLVAFGAHQRRTPAAFRALICRLLACLHQSADLFPVRDTASLGLLAGRQLRCRLVRHQQNSGSAGGASAVSSAGPCARRPRWRLRRRDEEEEEEDDDDDDEDVGADDDVELDADDRGDEDEELDEENDFDDEFDDEDDCEEAGEDDDDEELPDEDGKRRHFRRRAAASASAHQSQSRRLLIGDSVLPSGMSMLQAVRVYSLGVGAGSSDSNDFVGVSAADLDVEQDGVSALWSRTHAIYYRYRQTAAAATPAAAATAATSSSTAAVISAASRKPASPVVFIIVMSSQQQHQQAQSPGWWQRCQELLGHLDPVPEPCRSVLGLLSVLHAANSHYGICSMPARPIHSWP
uniref:E3 ubiquitin-protein ligase n=1 Tax=Macrostomum lignano TaxID=282301 RepID=A0A1I8FKG8_9PLAT